MIVERGKHEWVCSARIDLADVLEDMDSKYLMTLLWEDDPAGVIEFLESKGLKIKTPPGFWD